MYISLLERKQRFHCVAPESDLNTVYVNVGMYVHPTQCNIYYYDSRARKLPKIIDLDNENFVNCLRASQLYSWLSAFWDFRSRLDGWLASCVLYSWIQSLVNAPAKSGIHFIFFSFPVLFMMFNHRKKVKFYHVCFNMDLGLLRCIRSILIHLFLSYSKRFHFFFLA